MNSLNHFEKVEQRLGVKLPDAYKAFASHYGNQKVKEGTWVNPQNLQGLHNFDSVDNDLSLIDTSTQDLQKLIPVLVDEIEGDLIMLDYRRNTNPEVFTVKAQSKQKNTVFKSFSEFLDTTCKNYSLKAKYLDVVEVA